MKSQPSAMSVSRRLTIAFVAVISVFLAVSGITLHTSHRLQAADGWNSHTYKVLDIEGRMLASMVNMDNPVQQERLGKMKTRREEFVTVVKAMQQIRRDVKAKTTTYEQLLAKSGSAKDKAAKEIKSLIGANVAKVEVGARQVNEADDSIAAIVSEVQRVSQLISELSVASAEQAQGIFQVGEAVTQMDRVTQQNATLVEESAAAADRLRQQAASPTALVNVFKLAGDVYSGSASQAAAEQPLPKQVTTASADPVGRHLRPARRVPDRSPQGELALLSVVFGDEWESP